MRGIFSACQSPSGCNCTLILSISPPSNFCFGARCSPSTRRAPCLIHCCNLALEKFKTGKSSILIATDLAARGIDIPELPCVINYDLPRSPADYVHRIGRTARAGEQGQTLAFIDHESDAHFKLIEKRNQIRIPREQIPGFERNTDVPEHVLAKKGQAPVKGKRKSKKDKLREAAAAEKRTKHIWAGKP